jgi:enoyl-CoA hydratase
MNQLVTCQIENQIATITMQNGKVNTISHQVIEELNQAFSQAEQTQAVVVLRGQAGTFSGGYDFKVMRDSTSAAMALVEKGSTLAKRMLSFPYPVLAACNGHAVARAHSYCWLLIIGSVLTGYLRLV